IRECDRVLARAMPLNPAPNEAGIAAHILRCREHVQNALLGALAGRPARGVAAQAVTADRLQDLFELGIDEGTMMVVGSVQGGNLRCNCSLAVLPTRSELPCEPHHRLVRFSVASDGTTRAHAVALRLNSQAKILWRSLRLIPTVKAVAAQMPPAIMPTNTIWGQVSACAVSLSGMSSKMSSAHTVAGRTQARR